MHWLHPFLGTYRHCFCICLLSFLHHLVSPISARPFSTNIQTCCNFLQWISWTCITFRHHLVLLFVCLFLCLLQNFSKMLSYAVCFHFLFYQFSKTLCFFSQAVTESTYEQYLTLLTHPPSKNPIFISLLELITGHAFSFTFTGFSSSPWCQMLNFIGSQFSSFAT